MPEPSILPQRQALGENVKHHLGAPRWRAAGIGDVRVSSQTEMSEKMMARRLAAVFLGALLPAAVLGVTPSLPDAPQPTPSYPSVPRLPQGAPGGSDSYAISATAT